MNDQDKVNRAGRARELLDNALLAEAWVAVRGVYVDRMQNASTDAETLEAKRMIHALGAVRSHIERVVTDGQVAASDIKDQAERKTARGWLRLLE